jgi:hypothetical protein
MSRKIKMNEKVATGALIAIVCLQLGSARLMAESLTTTQPTTAPGSDARSGATLSKVGPTTPVALSASSLRRAKEMQQAERDRAAREATYAADRAMRSGVTVADPVLSTAVVVVPVGPVKPVNPVEALASTGTVNAASSVRNDFAGKNVATLFATPKLTSLHGVELRPVTLSTHFNAYQKDLPAVVAPFSSASAVSRQITLPTLLP